MCIELPIHFNIKPIITVIHRNISRANIAAFRFAKAQNLAFHALNGLERVFIIAIDDNQSIFRRQQAKFMERMDDIIQIFKEVQVVGLDIEHDRNGGSKRQKRVAILTRFGHKAAVSPNAQSTTNRRQITAHHNCRVKRRLHGNQCHHRSGRRFAMCTRQADNVLIIGHQATPSLCAFHDRYAQLMRAGNFGVIVMYCRCANDQRRAIDV